MSFIKLRFVFTSTLNNFTAKTNLKSVISLIKNKKDPIDTQ